MKLGGYRCDQCGAESMLGAGRWCEYRRLDVRASALDSGMYKGDAQHYCSPKCLIEYLEATRA